MAGSIILTDHDGGAETRVVCRVCQKQFAKYTCPRCNLRYCSLTCYKGHSVRCTESFMKENVLQEMRDLQSTPETKQKTLRMLKRLHFDEAGRSILDDENLSEEDSEDDFADGEGNSLSETTVQKILSDLDELTDSERKYFLRSLAAGKVSHLIEPWNPWWFNPLAKNVSITSQGMGLVQPVEDVLSVNSRISEMFSDSQPQGSFSSVPAPPSKPLDPVRELTRKEPAPTLSVHLAEVLYGYCFTLRYYNGDWRSEPLEAAAAMLSVSHVLGQGTLPGSVSQWLYQALEVVCSPVFKDAGGSQFGVGLVDDCAAILRLGRACVICALADLHNVLETARLDLVSQLGHDGKKNVDGVQESQGDTYRVQTSSGKTNKRSSRASSRKCGGGEIVNRDGREMELKRITAGLRKVYFLMCWANEQVKEIFTSTALLVEAEKGRLAEKETSVGREEYVNGANEWEGDDRHDKTKVLLDPDSKNVECVRVFGDLSKRNAPFPGTYDLSFYPFDWGKEYELPAIPEADLVIYKMIVCAFTADESSGVDLAKRGSFLGVIEKISWN